MTAPRVRVHEDRRMVVFDPVSLDKLRKLAPGVLAETLYQRVGRRPWRLVWNPNGPLGDEFESRLTDDDVSGPGWQDATIVLLPDPADPSEPLWPVGDRHVEVDHGYVYDYDIERTPQQAREHAAAELAAAAWAERHAAPETGRCTHDQDRIENDEVTANEHERICERHAVADEAVQP